MLFFFSCFLAQGLDEAGLFRNDLLGRRLQMSSFLGAAACGLAICIAWAFIFMGKYWYEISKGRELSGVASWKAGQESAHRAKMWLYVMADEIHG